MKRGIRQNAILQWVIEAGKPISSDELLGKLGAAPAARGELHKRIHRMVESGVLQQDDRGRLLPAKSSKRSTENNSGPKQSKPPAAVWAVNKRDRGYSTSPKTDKVDFSRSDEIRVTKFDSNENSSKPQGRGRGRVNDEGREPFRGGDRKRSYTSDNRSTGRSSRDRSSGRSRDYSRGSDPTSTTYRKPSRSRENTLPEVDGKTRIGRLVFLQDKPCIQFRGGKEDPKPVDLTGWGHLRDGDMISVVANTSDEKTKAFEVVSKIGEAQSFGEIVQEFYREFGVNPHYPKKAILQAESMAKDAMQKKSDGRRELSNQWVVVIDPKGARDHDDACFVEKKPEGGWSLYVHIADVAEFVPEQTPLDEAALKRSFTQYFPWASVPMLPEVLSANICSLRQDESRKALSCKMEISTDGIITSYEFFESWIRVAQFLTYEEAMEAFAAGNGQVMLLAEVAGALNAKRKKDLIFLFDLPEPQFEMNAKGEPIAMKGRTHLASHNWIEECMLAANTCCAGFLVKNKLPGMHRVHEPPEVEEIRKVMHIYELISHVIGKDKLPPIRKIPTAPQEMRQLYGALLNNSELGSAAALLQHMQTKLLRTMKKANYNTSVLGHFALGWELYAHFTSPIRRYPDLWNHRLIKNCLNKRKVPGAWKTEAKDATEHINETELDIMKLERKSHRAAMAWILREYLGEVFDAQVCSIDGKGIAVFIRTEDVFGEIWNPLSRLNNDYYDYSEEEEVLVGRKNGAMIRVGDPMKVRIIRTSPGRAEIDLDFML